jgi:D-sedoheptulose 7-phosphate isomerase
MVGKNPFRVISLTDNVPLITAWANDANYEDIFSAQLRPLIRAKDVAMAISCSGNSPNVLSALRVARELGAVTLGLGGYAGGKMAALCDVCVVAPSDNMQQIEDAHVCTMHAVFLALTNLIQNTNVALTAKGAAAR